jgi:peptidoglycan/xylan/chitin deacetylase (PgdA/CDA1 family)
MQPSRALRRSLAVAIMGLMLSGLWLLAGARSFQLCGRLVTRAPTRERRLALTFDDGPTPAHADEILTALANEDVHATFFVTGAELARHRDLGRRLVAAGHELGNHSWSHRRMLLCSTEFIGRELEDTDVELRRAGQHEPLWFRPPFGKKLLALPLYLERHDRTTVMWDLEPDSDPALAGSAARLVDYVRARARPGSIVLLHAWYDARGESRRAIGPLARALKHDGWQLVTVGELLAPRR